LVPAFEVPRDVAGCDFGSRKSRRSRDVAEPAGTIPEIRSSPASRGSDHPEILVESGSSLSSRSTLWLGGTLDALDALHELDELSALDAFARAFTLAR
jgi:hypothetical protein